MSLQMSSGFPLRQHGRRGLRGKLLVAVVAALATASAASVALLPGSGATQASAPVQAPVGAEPQDCPYGEPQCPTAPLSTPGLEHVREEHDMCPGSASLGRACPAWKHKGGEEEPPEPPAVAPPYDPDANQSYLGVQHANRYPARLAEGPDGRIYVSDPRAGSVFVYDSALNVVGEIKGLARPLGVAVGPDGSICVGSKGRGSVEVYSAAGAKLRTIGAGTVQMPNDLALDRDGNLYVADSRGDKVRVYGPDGGWLRNIGAPDGGDEGLRFPSAVTIAYRSDTGFEIGELYVADQGHSRVCVYDLAGTLLRTYGTPATMFSWKGRFARLQSLAVDAQGRLHAADCYMNRVQILDADTGAYLGDYGGFGTGPGQLNVPLGILITRNGQVVAANTGNSRVEAIYTIP